ncbi:hypothetical protein H7I77_20765 [Mycolicibacterium novocastrense]|uniref:Bacterial CdiA-CT RNAse A domain-containing protein n=1 Tax=Mycolicibacterium novocastrense TaxID=59813 RepID=A0AAW5SQ66_MYCNV|nr:RNase A-like domain-containing protein [Mycolicibacterium novocastrense]MCV7025755.1 hypothetical protein [Mycolicibacterium novocastrense]GAT07837.1 uncharacterized protein RMCN_0970 [Mycolicibacterium novocastrense]
MAVPSRPEIEAWGTRDLDDAAARWREAATTGENAFDTHRQNIVTPGGTAWEGDAKDAALDRVTADLAVARRQGDVQREAADIAEEGARDIAIARGRVLDAIAEAEAEGFEVGKDLSVTDTRPSDVDTVAARATAAAEHAEYIRWRAEQLAATDRLVGRQLQAEAAELKSIQFEPDGEINPRDPTIQLVDNRTETEASDAAAAGGGADAAEGAVGVAHSPMGELLAPDKAADPEAPGDLDEALTEIAGGQLTAPPTASEQILNQHSGTGKADDKRYTLSPLEAPVADADPAVLDQQRSRVEEARANLDDAQAALDDAVGQTYAQGAGGGTGKGETVPLTHAVFEARRELVEQTQILEGLNRAAAETGAPTAQVPQLPPNADVQAFPPEPSAFAEGSRALSEGSFGLIPDVAHDIDVLTNWNEHSTTDKIGAVADVAGMAPIPGGKFFAEGVEHGLDALGATRHLDDVPITAADNVADAAPPHVPDTPDLPDVHPSSSADVLPNFGLEETHALLDSSEASGGHLIARHVDQSLGDMFARLEARPSLDAVSTFATQTEAAEAVGAALRHNQSSIETWVANGSKGTLVITAPFDGGAVLMRGATEVTPGTSSLVVLKGDGMGNWHVLTGYVTP